MKPEFEISEVLSRIETAIAPFPQAALFELRERGYGSLFEQLVACILSIRTYDEESLPAALKLFSVARTPREIAALSVGELDALIRNCTFHEAKSAQIVEIARRIENEFGGELPANLETLISFRGVGPKCAHLALGIACDEPFIGVDIHVHRVTNRWGYIAAKTPEKSLGQLEEKLAREFWIEINRLLVPFGKHICTGTLPRCSSCPVAQMCERVGVVKSR